MAVTVFEPEKHASDWDPVRRPRFSRLPGFVSTPSPELIYIGMAMTMAGFGLIAVTWGQVAGETQVSEQLPYVVSGGFTAIGLIMAGLTVINGAVRRRDDRERDNQIDELVGILGELEAAIRTSADEPEPSSRRADR